MNDRRIRVEVSPIIRKTFERKNVLPLSYVARVSQRWQDVFLQNCRSSAATNAQTFLYAADVCDVYKSEEDYRRLACCSTNSFNRTYVDIPFMLYRLVCFVNTCHDCST